VFLILWKGKEAKITSQKILVFIMLSDVSEKEVLKEQLTKRNFYNDEYVFKRIIVGLNDEINKNSYVLRDLEEYLQSQRFDIKCRIF